MQREEAIQILGLDTAEARDFSNVRTAYHRRMRAVHPDLNPHPDASAATAMVSAAYDLLYRAHRAARTAEARRQAADAPRANGSAGRSRTATATGATRTVSPRARVLNDSTLTVTGTPGEVFSLVLSAARRLGEVSHAERDDGMIAVVAEFLHTAPCSVSLQIARRGTDRSHVRCHVEPLSNGEAPPVAAVTRLIAQTIGEVQASAAS